MHGLKQIYCRLEFHSSFDTGWVKPFDDFFYAISPTNAFVWQFFSDVLQMDRMSHLIIFIVLIKSCVIDRQKLYDTHIVKYEYRCSYSLFSRTSTYVPGRPEN